MSLVFDNALGICNVKFSDDQVAQILAEHEEHGSIAKIASDWGVDYNKIYRIVTGRTYRHVNPKPKRIRNTDTDNIVYLIEQGFSVTAVAEQVGISSQAVGRAYKRETGKTVTEYRRQRAVRYGEKT